MKNLFKLFGCYLAIGCTGLFCPQYLHAQEIIRGDTSYTKWKNSIVFVHSVYTRKEPPFAKDTLAGTAFLLTDHGKLYLVTTKHLLQADLYGRDQQVANDSVYLRPILTGKNMNISGLSGKDGHKSAVTFSNDEEDIAVISLQKTAYKDIAAYLLTHDRPVAISLIDTGNNHEADEWLMRYQCVEFVWPKERKEVGGKKFIGNGGMATFQINQYTPSASFFTIKTPNVAPIAPGNNGAPVVANDKLIGILSNATGIVSNRDIIQNPYYAISTGRVIKAAYIVQCLRKIQQMEDDPAFDR